MEQSITFEGTGQSSSIFLNGIYVGDIYPNPDESHTEVASFSVFDLRKNKEVNSSCTSINAAKAFAEYHFGKEAQP